MRGVIPFLRTPGGWRARISPPIRGAMVGARAAVVIIGLRWRWSASTSSTASGTTPSSRRCRTRTGTAFIRLLFLYKAPRAASHARLLRRDGLHRHRRRPHLPRCSGCRSAGAAGSRASFIDEWLADRAYYRISSSLDRRRDDHRQPRPAHRRRPARLRRRRARWHRSASTCSPTSSRWPASSPSSGSLSGSFTVFGITIPGYMVWVALVYSIFGTWLTHWSADRSSPLNFQPAARRGGFPFRPGAAAREHGRRRALWRRGGGKADAAPRFLAVANWWQIMQRTKWLNTLTTATTRSPTSSPSSSPRRATSPARCNSAR